MRNNWQLRGQENYYFMIKLGFPRTVPIYFFYFVDISVSDESANDSVRDETTFEMQHNGAAISFLPNLTVWEIECRTHK